MNICKRFFLSAFIICSTVSYVGAQTFTWYSTTQVETFKETKIRFTKSGASSQLVVDSYAEPIVTFKDWGATFNELDWDALNVLTSEERTSILHDVFSPDGELQFTRGRISMNANDYARSWYSCDEVAGDFELRFFNIDRDKETIIPFIHAAQQHNPKLTFWVSPWCPPSWMKINGDYPVLSSRFNNMPKEMDYLLYGNTEGIDPDEMKLTGRRGDKFPRQLATNNYMIQDSRYLQAYANCFCRFIDLYKVEGIDIDMVIYQNEAYSYTPYPGCAWTADGTVRFNRDYLGPTLRKNHPEVKLYLGTFNTNRIDYVQKIASDTLLNTYLSGMAFQWEGRESLPVLRAEHPEWSYMCSESECGWGSFDWGAAEHTFELINHYLGNGCNEYTIWNIILTGNGESPWGWKQNALIRVDTQAKTYQYTPEYRAVEHYSRFVRPGSRVVGYKPEGTDHMPILAVRTADEKLVVIAGNFADVDAEMSVNIDGKILAAVLAPHSFNSFVMK